MMPVIDLMDELRRSLQAEQASAPSQADIERMRRTPGTIRDPRPVVEHAHACRETVIAGLAEGCDLCRYPDCGGDCCDVCSAPTCLHNGATSDREPTRCTCGAVYIAGEWIEPADCADCGTYPAPIDEDGKPVLYYYYAGRPVGVCGYCAHERGIHT